MLDLQGNPVRWRNSEHALAQIRHACRRASERYGFEFTPEDYEALRQRLIAQFRDQTGIVFLYKRDKPSTVFAVWHGGEWMVVVYHRPFKTIVTFLPRGVVARYRGRLPW